MLTPLDKNTEKLDLRGVFVLLKFYLLSILSQNLKNVPRGTFLVYIINVNHKNRVRHSWR